MQQQGMGVGAGMGAPVPVSAMQQQPQQQGPVPVARAVSGPAAMMGPSSEPGFGEVQKPSTSGWQPVAPGMAAASALPVGMGGQPPQYGQAGMPATATATAATTSSTAVPSPGSVRSIGAAFERGGNGGAPPLPPRSTGGGNGR
jgi:hypothetical protein